MDEWAELEKHWQSVEVDLQTNDGVEWKQLHEGDHDVMDNGEDMGTEDHKLEINVVGDNYGDKEDRRNTGESKMIWISVVPFQQFQIQNKSQEKKKT